MVFIRYAWVVSALVTFGACKRTPGSGDPVVAAPRETPPRDATPEASPHGTARASVDASSATTPTAAPIAGLVPSRGPFNVILLTVDSLRGDLFHPPAGEPRHADRIAPTLAAFERRSVRYTRGYALSSYTSQSIGGLLAGRIPSELARSGFFFGHYPESVTFFPEVLRASGVRTLAAMAHWYFGRGAAGFEQGFDVYELVPGLHRSNVTDLDVTSEAHVTLVQRILGDRANTGGRFFAFFHFMDPHDEYRVHDGIPIAGRRQRDRYEGEITFTDRSLAGLLTWIDQQPWSERTVVIVSADHGESFGEHGHWRHGFEVWEELVHVPLMIRVPGAAPREVTVPRSHGDLAPTLFALLGVPTPADLPGTSLVDEIRGGPTPDRDVWVDLARTSNNSRRRALIHGRYKIISSGEDGHFETYDLETDPHELHPLRATNLAVHDDMVRRYRDGVRSFHDVAPYAARFGAH